MKTVHISRQKFFYGAVAAAVFPFLFLALVTFGYAQKAGAAEKIKLTLPWIPEGEVAFMYVAQKKGLWKKRGLDVAITRGYGSGEAAKTVGLGQYDFGQADMGVSIKGMGQGLPLVSIAMVNQRSPVCIVTLKGSGITAPKDLAGKRVGDSAHSGSNVLWPAFAKANGIEMKSVKRIMLSPGLTIQSLRNKNVDAVGSFYQSSAPYLWADKIPFNLILYADHGLDIYSLTFITQKARLEKSPDQVRRFVEGVMEGLKFSYLNAEETLNVFVKSVPESGKSPRDREISRHSMWINTALGLVDDVVEHGLGWHNRNKVTATLDKVKTYMGLKKDLPVDSLYTNKFAGTLKLSADEWKRVREGAKRYLTR
ncbi:MAG: ABC transporter substrate-binding protein [Nitrospinota bacterium]